MFYKKIQLITLKDCLNLILKLFFERRVSLCKKFSEDTSKHEKLTGMFPKNNAIPYMMTRNHELFKGNMAFTERYQSSAIQQMHRMVNENILNE